MDTPLVYVLWACAAYLLGSVSFGDIVARLAGFPIRDTGTGNPGAANVFREMGPKYAVAVMALVSLRSFQGGGSLLDSTLAVWSEAAPLIITAAAAALVLTEVGRSIVVIARRLEEGLERVRERRRAEGREEGRAEGLAEGLAKGEAKGRAAVREAWQAWNQRRIEAAERGEAFTEPPPEDAT